MIEQFVQDILELEKSLKNPNYLRIYQQIIDTIFIFYDYCLETNDPLNIALKYMIDNKRRPMWSGVDDFFYWMTNWSDDGEYYWRMSGCYWHLPKPLFDKMYPGKQTDHCIGQYIQLVKDLMNGLK